MSRKIYGQQAVLISGVQLKGVQSVNGNYALETETLLSLEGGYLGQFALRPQLGNFNFSRYFQADDIIPGIILKQNNPNTFGATNGALRWDTNSIIFNSGFVTSYKVSASVGEIPTEETSLTIYDALTAGTGNPPSAPGIISVIKPGSINVSNGEVGSNRVVSVDYEYAMELEAIYYVNNFYPSIVQRKPPTIITATVTFDIDDYDAPELSYCTETISPFVVTASGLCPGDTLKTLINMQSGIFYGMSFNSSISQALQATLTFREYIK